MTILPKKTRAKDRHRQHQQPTHVENPVTSSSSSRIPAASTSGNTEIAGPPARRQRISGTAGVSAANSLNCSPVASPCSSQLDPAGAVLPASTTALVGCKRSHHQQSSSADPDYNSDDENVKGRPEDHDLERRFEQHLQKAKGYRIKHIQGDGACLFRAVADQIYGDEDMHDTTRTMCLDYMVKNRDHFSQFITEDFNEYIERKRSPNCHGNHPEMQAMAEIYNRPIHVYEYSVEPINTFQPEAGKDNPPIRLSYHNGTHYNSINDPYNATVGVGLGLPQFYPGLAERNLLKDAQLVSDQQDIEEQMLKDKLAATDWEATQEQLTEQAARESYFEYVREQERYKSKDRKSRGGSVGPKSSSAKSAPVSPAATGSSACSKPTTSGSSSSSASSANQASSSSASSCQPPAVSNERASSFVADHSAAFVSSVSATGDFSDDTDLLEHVLALSQQEYYEHITTSGPSTSK